ncbi:MAG: hypothetical protein JO166_06420 [Deltaproteobacteria bacterium]|nr:hypothetical protein [Deltaproteobacteria bacterium]
MDSMDASGAFGIDRIEIGQDTRKISESNGFDMEMADFHIPPQEKWKKKDLAEVLSTKRTDKGCKLCHKPHGMTKVRGLEALLSRDLSPFKNDFNEHLASYVVGTNNPTVHHWEFGTYRGSDEAKLTRFDVLNDNLKPVCKCIEHSREAIKNDSDDSAQAHFPRNQKRMLLGTKQKHPDIDAELNVMTNLCEQLDNYVSRGRRSEKRVLARPTVVGAIGTASMGRGAKSHERLLHH